MGVKLFYKFKPLPCRDVERALRNLGFIEEKRKATSHRQWRKVINGRLYKVTFDGHQGNISALNVVSIIKQAGVSKQEFYNAIG